MVVRYIPGTSRRFDSLGLPMILKDLIMEKRGLILMVGATGSGKTTTLASMLDYRNEQKSGHILTSKTRSNSSSPTRNRSSTSARSAPTPSRCRSR